MLNNLVVNKHEKERSYISFRIIFLFRLVYPFVELIEKKKFLRPTLNLKPAEIKYYNKLN